MRRRGTIWARASHRMRILRPRPARKAHAPQKDLRSQIFDPDVPDGSEMHMVMHMVIGCVFPIQCSRVSPRARHTRCCITHTWARSEQDDSTARIRMSSVPFWLMTARSSTHPHSLATPTSLFAVVPARARTARGDCRRGAMSRNHHMPSRSALVDCLSRARA